MPTAEKVSDKLNTTAEDLAENADQFVDDLSAQAMKQAERVAKEAKPQADKLSKELMDRAKGVEENAEPTAQDYAKEISANAKKVLFFIHDIGYEMLQKEDCLLPPIHVACLNPLNSKSL